MANPTGHRKLLEQLHADGIRYLFGNPGSSEEGLLDEITRFPAIRYIHGLQEAAIVGVADGLCPGDPAARGGAAAQWGGARKRHQRSLSLPCPVQADAHAGAGR